MSPPTGTTHGEPIAGEQLERRLEELLHQDASRRRCGSLPTSASTTRLYTTRPGLDAHEFWAEQARTLDWAEPFTTILDNSNAPFYKWFTDGKLNVSYNCVDRHVEAGRGNRVAFHWAGEEGEQRAITYADLHRDVRGSPTHSRASGSARVMSLGSTYR
jgi:acetyl-CoA synthetase